MTQNDHQKTIQTLPQLCPVCKDMYGHSNYDYLCSGCFKQREQSAPKRERPIQPPPTQQVKQKPQPKVTKGKCSKCCKKIGLLGYDCSHCKHSFCKFHRLPEQHDCQADFVAMGRKQIKLDNPTVVNRKISDI